MQILSHKNKAEPMPVYKKKENTVAERLQKQVANAFNLYMNYKHYHWQTFGPMSRDLNIIFDEFANEVYSTVEILSQRIRMLGQNRVRIREFSKNSTVKPSKQSSNVRRMLEEADSNALMVITEMREAIRTTEREDPVTAKILKGFLKMQEKHQWWLRHILDNREGLTN